MNNIYFLVLLICSSLTYAQVGIGIASPDPSAALDVTSTDRGVLVPRMTEAQRDAIVSPATGLLIYQTDNTAGFYYFNATWQSLIQNSNTLDQAYDEGGAGVGNTIIADSGAVKIEGEDGIVVTGTFGSGAAISESGVGTRMFFNPRKAAFRVGYIDGAQWDNANVGNYSFATGYNTTASGARSFAANNNNEASGINATAFGRDNISSGSASFATGNDTTASGNNAFSSGSSTIASGKNSFASGSNSRAISINEVVLGHFPLEYTLSNADSNETFYTTDRAFAIGIGSSITNRKSAFEVWKDGSVKINEAYTLPKADGSEHQIITSDGAGNLSWTDSANNIVSQSMYATDTSYSYTDTVNTDDPSTKNLGNFETIILPDLYNASGNIQIKLILRCTDYVGTPVFGLKAKDGSSTTFPISFSTTQTYTATQTGGVVETDWKDWNAGTAPYELLLQSQTNLNESFTIANVYILIRSQ